MPKGPEELSFGLLLYYCSPFFPSKGLVLYWRTDAATTETIRIYLVGGVLVPFLSTRQKEVHDIMRTLFSQEAVWEIERHNIREEGREEGRQEGVEAGIVALVNELQK